MPEKQLPRPTDGELEILAVLWSRGASTVREVHEIIIQHKPAQYTTVLKLLQIMAEKGLVSRDATERAHRYKASRPREWTQRQLAGDLLKRGFAGSAKSLMLGALSARKTSKAELAEMRRLLDEYEKGGTMNFATEWIHLPLVNALGWTLVHFLWEGALIALVTATILTVCRGSKARYGAACLAVLAMLVAFGITLAVSIPGPRRMAQFPRVLTGVADPNAAGTPDTPALGILARVQGILPWVVPVWMAGALLVCLYRLGGWVAAQRMRRVGVCAAPPAWQERLGQLARRIGVTTPLVLLESSLAEVPLVMGLLRPAILVPAGLLAGLPPGYLEAILLHELAHIRRFDYLVNLTQTLVESLLFYHPAVWWLSGLIRAERENCCDDAVVAVQRDARTYAAAVVTLEERRSAGLEPALAATGGQLMNRICRLLDQPREPRVAAALILSLGLLLGVSCLAAAARQTSLTTPVQVTAGQETRLTTAYTGKPIDLRVKELDLAQFFRMMAEISGLNIAVDPDVSGKITIEMRAVPWDQIFDLVLEMHRLDKKIEGNVVRVARKETLQGEYPAKKALKPEPKAPYRQWLSEDVVYIIANEEKAAFEGLQTDAEREEFIRQFWLRRDPTPGTPANEMKEEHYRRIAYANAKFGSGTPGWATDRGRIYIVCGPPDEIAGNGFLEQWRYRYIEGIGNDVVVEFVDAKHSGDFRLTGTSSAGKPVNFVRM